MARLILVLFLSLQIGLESVEFVLFTQPKTATHLLIPILNELTGKDVYWAPEYTLSTGLIEGSYSDPSQNPEDFVFTIGRVPWDRATMDLVWATNKQKGTFLHLHAPYSETMESYLAEKNCVNFFVKRDPRDQIISLLNHYKHIRFNDKEVEAITTDDERLLYMIQKESRAHTLYYMGWVPSDRCCALDFEKLMGAHGGTATYADALKEVKKITTTLQLKVSQKYLKELYNKHFGKGWNFFKGKVGVWKEYFNAEHKAEIKKQIGDLLIELGYEKDLDW